MTFGLDHMQVERLLTSGEHLDAEGMPLTVVDGLFAIAESIDRLTDAVSSQVATGDQAGFGLVDRGRPTTSSAG